MPHRKFDRLKTPYGPEIVLTGTSCLQRTFRGPVTGDSGVMKFGMLSSFDMLDVSRKFQVVRPTQSGAIGGGHLRSRTSPLVLYGPRSALPSTFQDFGPIFSESTPKKTWNIKTWIKISIVSLTRFELGIASAWTGRPIPLGQLQHALCNGFSGM